MAQRIKGQEVVVSVAGPNGSEPGLTDVTSFEAEFQIEILTEGYLGETADRRDDIFRGATGQIEIHLETPEYFTFAQRVIDRAQRRSPAEGQFNISASFAFPSGDRFRVLFKDVFFGALPVNTGGRSEYATATIPWECQDIDFVFL